MSNDAHSVRVALGPRSYDILIGSGNLETTGRAVAGWCRLTHAVVITDTNVAPPHAERCRGEPGRGRRRAWIWR